MTWFPKLSETFVLDEITALQQRGVAIALFPLLKGRMQPAHPQAAPLAARARFLPWLSRPIIAAHWHYLRRAPQHYWRTLVEVVAGTIRSPRFLFGALCFFPKTVRIAYEMERNDIAHVHAHFASNPALAALVIHRLTGIPFSFTAHGSDLHVDRTMLADKVRAAAFAVTISDFNRAVMTAACGEALHDKIHVVRCGIDRHTLQPPPSRRRGTTTEIVCVASLGAVKGHRYLIEACRLLARRGVEFRCHLVGDGPLRRRIVRQIAAAHLDNRFLLHGGLTRPAVIRLLHRCDLFALASAPTPEGRREGIPVALMEAMATGLAVVASRLSGIPELVEDGVSGLLVRPRESIALADALERCCTDRDLRERLGQNARRAVTGRFDLDRNVTRLIELFASAPASERRRSHRLRARDCR